MADRKTAEQIMEKKAFIKAKMEGQMPREQADALWRQATERLASIMARYADLPAGLRPHTDARIFPSAAIYLTAKLEANLRARKRRIAVITGHTGWSDDLDFVFAHRDKLCSLFRKRVPDPEAPYDGYIEDDDTEERARTVPLKKKG